VNAAAGRLGLRRTGAPRAARPGLLSEPLNGATDATKAKHGMLARSTRALAALPQAEEPQTEDGTRTP
jgi:hypothetical protein